jgi:hypothetical protein
MHRIVVETRQKEYRNPIKNDKGKVIEYKISYGTEIVKEIAVSQEEYEKYTGQKAMLERPNTNKLNNNVIENKKKFQNKEREEESERMRSRNRRRRQRNDKTPVR